MKRFVTKLYLIAIVAAANVMMPAMAQSAYVPPTASELQQVVDTEALGKAIAEPAPITPQAAVDQFFSSSSAVLSLHASRFIRSASEVLAPIRLQNGQTLYVEVPWVDESALTVGTTVTIRPAELSLFAGRYGTGEGDDAREIFRPVGAHVTNRDYPSLCANRRIAAEGVVTYADGTSAVQTLGFIYEPESSVDAIMAVAAGIGCPLLASHSDCTTHKYCEVRIGIPPFTFAVSGACWPGPWPLGSLCRCWLLAPDKKVVEVHGN